MFQIYCDGADADASSKMCGEALPELLTFNCSLIVVKFESDESVHFAGFRFQYNILHPLSTGMPNVASYL